MKYTKKHTALLCAILLCILPCAMLSGCAQVSQERDSIVCSSFILYDWVMNVLGEDADSWDVHILGARGSDIHSYEPTVRDIGLLSRCEVFVRIGGESETWAQGVIRSADNPHMTELSLCDALSDKLCSDESEHEHGHGHEGEAHDGHEHRYDEHIWFSPEYTYHSISHIKDTLSEKKPQMADTYRKNADAYLDTLARIEAEYMALANNSERKNIVVADRFPFVYLCEMMGLEYSAAFDGCSAESEASFSVVSRLAKVIDETGVGYVLVCESSDGRIADAVISATKYKNAQVLTLNSFQSLSDGDIGDADFVSVLRDNLKVLKIALSK